MHTLLKPTITPAKHFGAVHTWCPSTSACVPAHDGVVSTPWVSDTDSCSLLPRQTPLETSRALQQVQSTRLPPEVQKRCAHRFPVPSLVPNHKVVTLYKGTAPAPSNVGCCSELENGCVYIGVQLAPYSGHLARAILKRKRRQSWTRKIKNWSLTF